MNTKKKVHVIGSYAVGMTMRTATFPKEGETVPGYNFQQLHGGKGSNQAVGAARMGAEVKFTACVGQDMLGDAAIDMLVSEGIDITSVFRSPTKSTGVGFVMVGESGENEIVIGLEANEELNVDHIEKAFASGFEADVLLVQLEANLDAVFHAMKLAQDKGIPVVLNPAPYREVSDEFVKLATYITPNETEAESLLGRSGTPEQLCHWLYEKYGTQVILTAGKDGAYFTEIDKSNQQLVVTQVPVEKVKVVDTTGAGDCFNSSFTVAYAEGKPIHECVLVANTSATLSVQIDGVVESLPYREDVDNILLKKN